MIVARYSSSHSDHSEASELIHLIDVNLQNSRASPLVIFTRAKWSAIPESPKGPRGRRPDTKITLARRSPGLLVVLQSGNRRGQEIQSAN